MQSWKVIFCLLGTANTLAEAFVMKGSHTAYSVVSTAVKALNAANNRLSEIFRLLTATVVCVTNRDSFDSVSSS